MTATDEPVKADVARATATEPDAPAAAEPNSTYEFAMRLGKEAEVVIAEVEEIGLLISQAKTEAARHESRRQAGLEKLQMYAERLAVGAGGTPKELADLANQLVTIGRKAALMEAQIDLLEGKKRSGQRLADAIKAHEAAARVLAGLPEGGRGLMSAEDAAAGTPLDIALDHGAPMPPGVSRMILNAQEDMRREIARQMH